MSRKIKSYADKLRDPRWQKKKFELFALFGSCCQYPQCETEHMMIEVHHKVYLRGRDPWDYPNWCFQILCHEHHQVEQLRMERAHLAIASNPMLLDHCIANAIKNPIIEKPRKISENNTRNISVAESKDIFKAMRDAIR